MGQMARGVKECGRNDVCGKRGDIDERRDANEGRKEERRDGDRRYR